MAVRYGAFLKSNAFKYAGKVAIQDDVKSVTYGQLDRRVNSLASGLLALGLKKGDVVCQLQLNTVEHMEVIYATSRAGMVRLPLNPRAGKEECIKIMNYFQPAALVFDENFAPVVNEMRPALQCPRYIHAGAARLPDAVSYDELVSGYPAAEPDVDITEGDINIIQATSGTTGSPKGAARTHRESTMLDILRTLQFGYTPDDILLSTTMLANTATILFVLAHLFIGARVILRNRFDPLMAVQTIQRERVTNTPMVPVMYERILNLPDLKRYDLSSLTQLNCYGSPLHTDTKERIIQHICPNLYETYGTTESGFLFILRPADQLRKTRSVGQPALLVEHRLLGEDGKEVPPGEPGEVVVRTAYQFSGYYKNAEATAAVVKDGWYYTGDIGRFDEEGYLYIVGRRKDMIVSGGYNVYAEEVESVLAAHPAVAEVAVIGVPDAEWGEAVKACVVLRAGQSASAGELMQFCRDKLPGYKRPRSVDFMDSLPRTDLGKLLKRRLREKYWEGQERQVA